MLGHNPQRAGFYPQEDTGEAREPRSRRDRLAAKIGIRLKEGAYNDVVGLMQSAKCRQLARQVAVRRPAPSKQPPQQPQKAESTPEPGPESADLAPIEFK